MKKLIIAVLFCNSCFAQKITENITDEFTGANIKSTSWEYIYVKLTNTAKVRLRKVDDSYFLELKYNSLGMGLLGSGENNPLMLKTSDSIYKIYPKVFRSSCVGCGATGFGGSAAIGFAQEYILNKSDILRLLNSPVSKMRIYFTDGFEEAEIDNNSALSLIKMMKLIF
ncbi:MAG: hypothetical protein V4608_03450 [Bacteroidota bacterium]